MAADETLLALQLAGVGVGSRMVVEGAVGLHRNRLALLNPTYELRL